MANKIRVAWFISQLSLKKLMRNPKISVMIFLLGFHMWDAFLTVRYKSAELGLSVSPWSIPFIFNTDLTLAMLLMMVVVWFCDAPFMDEHQPYTIARSGRTVWFYGQVVYIIKGTFICLLLIVFFSILPIIDRFALSDQWGRVYTELASQDFIMESGSILNFNVSPEIIGRYSPVIATLLSTSLFWLNSIFLCLLMFALNLKLPKYFGTGLTLFVAFLGGGSSIYNNLGSFTDVLKKIIPTCWCKIDNISNNPITGRVSFVYAYTFLFIAIIALIIIARFFMKRYIVEILPHD